MSRYNIINRAAVPDLAEPRDIIFCHLPHNPLTPYATWVYDITQDDGYHGHYLRTYEEGLVDFVKRCRDKGALMYPTPETRPV